MMITSETQIRALIEKGNKERSDALFFALHWLLSKVSPKPRAAKKIGAAFKQDCPN